MPNTVEVIRTLDSSNSPKTYLHTDSESHDCSKKANITLGLGLAFISPSLPLTDYIVFYTCNILNSTKTRGVASKHQWYSGRM